MTQEERKQRRRQETKKAVLVVIGLVCMLTALIIGIVAAAGKFLEKKENESQTETTTERTDGTESETATFAPVLDEATKQAIAFVSEMTLEQKVAQMFVITPDALTNVTGTNVFGNTSKQAYSNYPVGGLILTAGNLKGEEQTKEMLKGLKAYAKEVTGLPVFAGVQEEGGAAVSIASSAAYDVKKVEAMSAIGAAQDANAAYEAGKVIGGYLSELGFNLNLAPVADILDNAENAAMKDRSFGSDTTLVSSMVLSMLQGLNEHQIYGVVKHFPGLGSTAGDGSAVVAENSKTLEELRESDLVVFQNAVNAGASFVMVGHISVPNITGSAAPASMSEYMITQILRKEMGFDGVVMTDALNKKAITESYDSAEAAVTAIAAGADMLFMPEDFKAAYEGVIAAVNAGTLTQEQINTAVVRIVKAKQAME